MCLSALFVGTVRIAVSGVAGSVYGVQEAIHLIDLFVFFLFNPMLFFIFYLIQCTNVYLTNFNRMYVCA